MLVMKARLKSIKKKKLHKTYTILCYVNGIYYFESPQASFILPSISKGRLHPHDSQAHLTPKQIDGPLPLY